jgi:hypothetical protein
LTCEIERGNPKDSELFQGTIEGIKKGYGKTPESGVADGGYASGANMNDAQGEGIANIVFAVLLLFPVPVAYHFRHHRHHRGVSGPHQHPRQGTGIPT